LVGIGALVCILAIGLDRSAVLSSTVVDFLLELMLSLAFWRSGSTEVQYCGSVVVAVVAQWWWLSGGGSVVVAQWWWWH